MNMQRLIGYTLVSATMIVAPLYAQQSALPISWNQTQQSFQVYGNTYYVGTRGLSSVLVTSPKGHILIDGALPESAALIVANIRTLGFRIEDVKLILNTHVHFDHAGGIAELQKLSGAKVAASALSAKVLLSGDVDNADPQFGRLPRIAPVPQVSVFKDGDTLTAGDIAITAHLTPGHTPGGTSWTWKSCVKDACLQVVYADSLNPISATGYQYTDPKRNPNGVTQLEKSFALLGTLPCDILLAPHPELVDLQGKLTKREQGGAQDPFVDAAACRAYVQTSREKLNKRVSDEHAH